MFLFLVFGWWANQMFGSIGLAISGFVSRKHPEIILTFKRGEKRTKTILAGNMVNQILTIVPFVTLLVPTIGKPSMNE